MLDLRHLSVSLPIQGGMVRALSDVTFSLARGETLGIVGASGSGKSTIALAIMGLLPDRARTSGAILFEDQDLVQTPEATLCRLRGRRLAMVFQEPMAALNPIMTIGAQVAEGMRLHLRLRAGEAAGRAGALLARVGLSAPRLYPHQLSGGQRQRVLMAIALAAAPALLIADEPTTALDVTIQAQILALLADLIAERAMALLLITHDLGVAADVTRRVAVLHAGHVVETGPTATVLQRPAHPYTHELVMASPLGKAAMRPAAIPGAVSDRREAGCAFADRCPRVQPDCRMAPPPLRPVGTDHLAACLHPFIAS